MNFVKNLERLAKTGFGKKQESSIPQTLKLFTLKRKEVIKKEGTIFEIDAEYVKDREDVS